MTQSYQCFGRINPAVMGWELEEKDLEAVNILRNVVKILKRNWETDLEDTHRRLQVLLSHSKA